MGNTSGSSGIAEWTLNGENWSPTRSVDPFAIGHANPVAEMVTLRRRDASVA
jgi:hypothetical protein